MSYEILLVTMFTWTGGLLIISFMVMLLVLTLLQLGGWAEKVYLWHFRAVYCVCWTYYKSKGENANDTLYWQGKKYKITEVK